MRNIEKIRNFYTYRSLTYVSNSVCPCVQLTTGFSRRKTNLDEFCTSDRYHLKGLKGRDLVEEPEKVGYSMSSVHLILFGSS